MDGKLDRTSSTPLYRQLKALIEGWLAAGELKPGERLPPERELGERFGVSRLTVRQALAELVTEGALVRIQGSGTYVARRRAKVVRALVSEREWVLALKEAQARYNAAHPHQPVEIVARVVGRPRLREELIWAVAAGQAPDLALVDSVWLAELARFKFLLPLDELCPDWAQEYQEDLLPVIRRGNDPGDGHLYGAQTEASAAVLWYRRDWLACEGQPVPRTWEELRQAAQTLQRHRHRYGLGEYPLALCGGVRGGETTTFQLLPLLWSLGEGLISGFRPALDGRAVEMLNQLEQLVNKWRLASPQVVGFSWDEPRRLFAQGKVAFSLGGTYEKRAIQSLARWDEREFRRRVGLTLVPGLTSRAAATSVVGGMAFGVLRQSKCPELASELVRLLASPEVMARFCQATGRTPSRQSVVAKLSPKPYWFHREVQAMLARARPRPPSPYYAKVSLQFRLMVEEVLTGRLTPPEAVERARHGIEAILAE